MMEIMRIQPLIPSLELITMPPGIGTGGIVIRWILLNPTYSGGPYVARRDGPEPSTVCNSFAVNSATPLSIFYEQRCVNLDFQLSIVTSR